MHPSNVASPANQSPSYRLTRLEVFNWGPFAGRHEVGIDGRGTAVIGPTGSGKTTLVDALMTLLVGRPRYNLASTGGHESDRDLVSYVRGVMGGDGSDGRDEVAPQRSERELRRELRRLGRDIRREERKSARGPGAPRKAMAVASLVLGIAAFPLYFLPTLGLAGLISAILALVFGVIARGRARKRPEEYGGRPLATAGFVLGIVGTVLPFAVLIAFVIAFQGF